MNNNIYESYEILFGGNIIIIRNKKILCILILYLNLNYY